MHNVSDIVPTNYRAIVIGASAGGVTALVALLGGLPRNFPLPLLIVQHIASSPGSKLAEVLDRASSLRVKEGEDCERVEPGVAYLAPPGYHMAVESNHTLSLNTDAPVAFARPSIDVLFDSAALVYGSSLIGIILTGANADGSRGLKRIKEKCGLVIVQDPADAEVDNMPRAALAAAHVDHIVSLSALPSLLLSLACGDTMQTQKGSRGILQ